MFRKMLVLSALLLCATAFAAAEDFTFTFYGQLNAVYGTFVTTPLGGGQFEITAIDNGIFYNSVTDTEEPIQLLSPGSYYSNDNILFDPPLFRGYLDAQGFSFVDTDGDYFNLSTIVCDPPGASRGGSEPDSCTLYILSSSNSSLDDLAFGFGLEPVGQVPEPATLGLLVTGLLTGARAFRRRFDA